MMITDGFLQRFGFSPSVPGAAGHHQADVAVAELVPAAGFDHRGHDLRMGHRDVQQDRLGRAEQPVNVLLQLEHPAVVGPNALEDAVPVQQPVVEDRNLGVALVVVFSVNINFHVLKPAPSYVNEAC